MTLDVTKLEGIIPNEVIAELTPDFLKRAYIDGPLRLSHFLGQCRHESGNFTRFSENLHYSAKILLQVFPKYFNEQNAQAFANQPEKIANRVYAGRYGNGPESSGDGYKYRGRGPIQITFKDNYAAFRAWSGIDSVSQPELLEELNTGLLSAAWFFANKRIMVIADQGITPEVIENVTLKVNGGTNGLEERAKYTKEIYQALTA